MRTVSRAIAVFATIILVIVPAIQLLVSVSAAETVLAPPATVLSEGWEKVVEIPEIKAGQRVFQQASKLKLWIELGWLVARYETVERGPEWEVVLAQAKDPQEPQVRLEKPRGFEITYGRYFIRENTRHLRMMRERKTKESPQLPEVSIDENAEPTSLSTSAGGKAHVLWKSGDWVWLTSGIMEQRNFEAIKNAPRRYDIWMRVHHAHEIPSRFSQGAFGSTSMPGEHMLMKMYVGNYTMHDEGDLFIAERSIQTEGSVRNTLGKSLQGKEAPELVAKRWWNSPMPLSLKQLRGKVVMLYFWSEQNYQPFAAIVQKQFKDRGLEVIAVHPMPGAEQLDALIKERSIDLPIALDTNRQDIARPYSIKVWPTYVLIDRSGKVRQAYLENPPIKEIEELLKQGQE